MRLAGVNPDPKSDAMAAEVARLHGRRDGEGQLGDGQGMIRSGLWTPGSDHALVSDRLDLLEFERVDQLVKRAEDTRAGRDRLGVGLVSPPGVAGDTRRPRSETPTRHNEWWLGILEDLFER